MTSKRRYISAFARIVSPGTFLVSLNSKVDGDLLPPSRVTDLTVKSISASLSTVSLTWTAVGDDLDEGQGTTNTYT